MQTKIAWLATVAMAIAAVIAFGIQARPWLCWCGQWWQLWISDAWGKHTSQHLADPYTLTHVLHGFLLYWLLVLILPRFRRAEGVSPPSSALPASVSAVLLAWSFCIAIAVEAAWEFFENTRFVIERYRQTTASVDYTGDSVINSIGDTIATGIGFLIAHRLGFRLTLVLFVAVELTLLLWIRDSLLLTIFMLAYPSETLKQWQAGH